MYYQSFIRLLHHVEVDYSNPENIPVPRVKKLLQAEFTMQEDGILTLDGIDYNKNDVLTELEHPEFIARIRYHKLIWNHNELLELLEHDAIDIPKSQQQWFSLHEDEDFRIFLSPLLAGAYNSVMKSLLLNYDFTQAELWQRFHVFLSPEDEDKAYQGTRIFLDESLSLFKNMNKQTYLRNMTELRRWEYGSWGPFLNKLPDSLFYYIDEMALYVINFSVEIQKLERELCLALSEQLCFLTRASQELKEIILKNHQIYKSNVSQQNKGGGSGISVGSWIWIGIVFVKIVISIGTCSSSYNPEFKLESSPLLDSLIRSDMKKDTQLLHQLRK